MKAIVPAALLLSLTLSSCTCAPTPTALPQGRPTAPPELPRCVQNGSTFALNREAAHQIRHSFRSLGADFRITPLYTEGVMRGFKLRALQPGSLSMSCGLREGDILETVNGSRMDSVERAAQVCRVAVSGTAFTIGLTRDGTAKLITITAPDSDPSLLAPVEHFE